VWHPFIGSGRRGGGRQGSDGDGGALSRWWPITEGEAKRRRHRLREGKGGGGRAASGGRRGKEEEAEWCPVEGGERRRRLSGIQSRAEEVAEGARRRAARPSDGARALGAGGRRRGRWARPGGLGPCWLGGN
jgi:hypothetical protein